MFAIRAIRSAADELERRAREDVLTLKVSRRVHNRFRAMMAGHGTFVTVSTGKVYDVADADEAVRFWLQQIIDLGRIVVYFNVFQCISVKYIEIH